MERANRRSIGPRPRRGGGGRSGFRVHKRGAVVGEGVRARGLDGREATLAKLTRRLFFMTTKLNHWPHALTRSLISIVLLVGAVGTAVGQVESSSAPSAATSAEKLVVGGPAPLLKVEKWVKGEPIKEFEKGTVYVVEFWATWCGPVRKSIPQLTALAEKHKSNSLKAIGISIWESAAPDGTSALVGVERFVSEMGDKMKYNVAYGGDKGGMADTWMRAADRSGLPTSFIVDKSGKIAWIGNPNSEREGMLVTVEAVLAGTFDPKAAAEAVRKAEEGKAKAKELGNKLKGALQGARAEEAMDIVREMLRVDPKLFPNAVGVTFQQVMINMGKQDAAYAFAREMFNGPAKDSPMDLNTMAWVILDDAAVKKRDIELAFELSKRAVEVTERKDGPIMDTLARAYFEKGDVVKALELQITAVELAKTDKRIPAAIIQQLEATLTRYRAAR